MCALGRILFHTDCYWTDFNRLEASAYLIVCFIFWIFKANTYAINTHRLKNRLKLHIFNYYEFLYMHLSQYSFWTILHNLCVKKMTIFIRSIRHLIIHYLDKTSTVQIEMTNSEQMALKLIKNMHWVAFATTNILSGFRYFALASAHSFAK